MKKLISIVLCIVLCTALAACGSNTGNGTQQAEAAEKYSFAAVPLTDEEQEILSLMGNDVTVVSDAEYVSTVAEILYHGKSFEGKVFQLEGTLSLDGEATFLCRNLVGDKETVVLQLPLRYLEKEISSGAWVRVTGIVSVTDDGHSVLDLVAIEGFAQQGQANISWDGGEIHQH